MHRFAVLLGHLLLLARLARLRHDASVRMKLREAAFKGLVRFVKTESTKEVHGHVVRGPKGRVQLVRSSRGEAGDILCGDRGTNNDDSVPFDVNAAAPRASRELRVLPRRNLRVLSPVKLRQLVQDDGARRHVDAEGEGFRCANNLDESTSKKILDHSLDSGKLTRVVGRESVHRRPLNPADPERVVVVSTQISERGAKGLFDLRALSVIREPHVRSHELCHGLIAAAPRKNEEDRGEHAALFEEIDDVGSAHCPRPHPLLVAMRTVRTTLVVATIPIASAARPAALPSPPVAFAAIAVTVWHVAPCPLADFGEHGIDLAIAPMGERPVRGRCPPVFVEKHVDELVVAEHVLPQRDRAALGNDHFRTPPHLLYPRTKLFDVRNGRAQRNELHASRQVNNDLFPHGPSHSIREVVDLIHHDIAERMKSRRIGVHHVAKDLGRHHDDLGFRIDVYVARHKPDRFVPKPLHKLLVLLIAQRLDWSRVEDLDAVLHGPVNGVLANDGFASARGSGNENGASSVQRVHGAQLERIEVKRKALGKVPAKAGIWSVVHAAS